MKAGISAQFCPTIKSERDKWLRFVRTHRANFNPSGKFAVCSVHFAEECFSRAVIFALSLADQFQQYGRSSQGTIFQTTTPQGKHGLILSTLRQASVLCQP